MEQNSPAIVLSREEDAKCHGYVMYGLVKPDKKGMGIESAAAMVNVIPRKRIYRMDEIEELEMFRDEILKRPLVMQPTVLSGKGLQKLNCFLFIQNENWVAMINQNHPKIQGRIMMGIDAAKKVMRRGEPFILEFVFSDIIRRLYLGSLSNALNIKNKFTDCEHGDLIIRYGGDAFHQGMSWEMKARHMKFSFEDVEDHEIMIRTLSIAESERRSPIIQVIPEVELRYILPGWSFHQAEEEVDEEEEENYDQYDEDDYYMAEKQSEAAAYPEPKPGRIRGRSNRGKPAVSTQEVSVELHVPSNNDDKNKRHYDQNDRSYEEVNTPYNSNSNHGSRYYTDLRNERTDHEYQTMAGGVNRYNHYHQGSGRSGSSAADSGYEENEGGFEDGKYGHLKSGNKKRFQDNFALPPNENYHPAGPDRYNEQNYSSRMQHSPIPRSPQPQVAPPSSDRYNEQTYPSRMQHSPAPRSPRLQVAPPPSDRYNNQMAPTPSDRYNDQSFHSGFQQPPQSMVAPPRSPQVAPPRSDRYNDSNSQSYRPPLNSKDRYNYDNEGFIHENYNVVESSVERNKAMAAKMLNQNNYQKLPSLTNNYRNTDMSSEKNYNYNRMPTISQSVDNQLMDESVI